MKFYGDNIIGNIKGIMNISQNLHGVLIIAYRIRILHYQLVFIKPVTLLNKLSNLTNHFLIFSPLICKKVYSLNLNQSNFHWLNQRFAFSLNHQWKQYFPLLNQLLFPEVISEIWLIRSNLFLAIRISQISLIISRFWLIHI